jgi:tetratricopeptide (TPR) repeat protein
MAELRTSQKRYDEAIAAAKAASDSDPTLPDAPYALANAAAGKHDAAMELAALNDALKLNPSNLVVQMRLAQTHFAAGRIDTAAQFAGQVVARRPHYVPARVLLTRVYLAQRNFQAADAQIALMKKDAPASVDVAVLNGSLLTAKNMRAEARREFERALQADANQLEALNGLVALDVAERKPDAARARLDTALQSHPKDVDLLFMAAQAQMLMQKPSAAEDLLKRTLAENPEHLQAYTALALVYAQQNRLADAQRQFEALAQKDPKAVWPRTMVAVLLQLQNNMPAAEKAYEQALQIDPLAPVAANNLAYLYTLRLDNLDVALRLAQAAKQKLPNEPAISDTLGWIYYQKNLADLAIRPLSESVEKDPSNALYHYHLGLAYAKVGDKVKARKSLERSIELNGKGEDADAARKVLATIG